MNWTDRRKRFRAILAGDRCVHPGSVFDPISARIAEDLAAMTKSEFEAAYIDGAELGDTGVE